MYLNVFKCILSSTRGQFLYNNDNFITFNYDCGFIPYCIICLCLTVKMIFSCFFTWIIEYMNIFILLFPTYTNSIFLLASDGVCLKCGSDKHISPIPCHYIMTVHYYNGTALNQVPEMGYIGSAIIWIKSMLGDSLINVFCFHVYYILIWKINILRKPYQLVL